MIPFSPPRIDQKIIDEVTDTLRSGWITTGPKTKKFEQELMKYTGAKSVLAVNSATAGLELILRWFGVREGDEVIVPAYTYCATANVVVHCGAKPVMVDVGADFNIDVEAVRKSITPRTKAIIPVDLGGLPCDYSALYKMIDDVKGDFQPANPIQQQLGRVLLLADCAHSIGATFLGKKAGVLADVSVFSFHAVKNLTTAEGGAICINLPEAFDIPQLYKKLNAKSLHGQSKDALEKFKLGGWEYDVVEAGFKCNMTDIMASIGLVELERYDKTLEKRRSIFNRYSEAFKKQVWAQVPEYESEERSSSYHLYLLRIKNITEQQRNQIIQKIFEQEVTVNVHYKPVPMMTFYRDLGYRIEDYPVSFDNYSREISLPVFYEMTEEQVEKVIHTVGFCVESVVNLKVEK